MILRDGEPGIILEGEGRSTVSHVRVEEATGVGIHIIGREVILNDVVVTNTRTGATEEGHGILVEDAPAFTANEVSSNGNAGSGLVASNTDSVSIIDPNYNPMSESVLAGATKWSFIPTTSGSSESIDPNYVRSDEDGISIIEPNYLNDGVMRSSLTPVPEGFYLAKRGRRSRLSIQTTRGGTSSSLMISGVATVETEGVDWIWQI